MLLHCCVKYCPRKENLDTSMNCLPDRGIMQSSFEALNHVRTDGETQGCLGGAQGGMLIVKPALCPFSNVSIHFHFQEGLLIDKPVP